MFLKIFNIKSIWPRANYTFSELDFTPNKLENGNIEVCTQSSRKGAQYELILLRDNKNIGKNKITAKSEEGVCLQSEIPLHLGGYSEVTIILAEILFSSIQKASNQNYQILSKWNI